jgi:hypothetical protein
MAPRHSEKGFIVFLVWFVVGAVYLSCGVRSGMPSYQGYLESASRYSRCTSSNDCGYYVNQRFLIHGNNSAVDSAHCTITRTKKYLTKTAVNKAVSEVVLGTTRTVWLKSTNHKVCFDTSQVDYNFAVGIVLVILGLAPCFVLACLFGTAGMKELLGGNEWASASDRKQSVPTSADMSPNSKTDNDGGDIELADAIVNIDDGSPTGDYNSDSAYEKKARL